MNPPTLPRILFVDDDPSVLDGLRRSLHAHRTAWDLHFLSSGREALAAMQSSPFDLIVADMMMPDMHGADFLGRVRVLHPDTIRFALSAQVDRGALIDVAGPVHQFLTKPTSADALWGAISRALCLRSRVRKSETRAIVSSVERLPSLPDNQRDLMRCLGSKDVSTRAVGEIIARDFAMTAKIMQLVNSAFFTRSKRASGPVEAVSRLGLDTIRSVAMSFHLFDSFQPDARSGLATGAIWGRACKIAGAARAVALAAGLPPRAQEQAYLAGLLHEVGRLVLASKMSSDYAEVIREARATSSPLTPIEERRFGMRQGELTAYLLGLWAFEDEVVDAVMHYELPSDAIDPVSGVLVALHLASATVHAPSHQAHVALDEAFLDRFSPSGDWRSWRGRAKAA